MEKLFSCMPSFTMEFRVALTPFTIQIPIAHYHCFFVLRLHLKPHLPLHTKALSYLYSQERQALCQPHGQKVQLSVQDL